MGDIIKKIDERGEFVYLEDGFLYYAPEATGGCISAHELRTIADELDKRNKAWEEQIDEYFRSGFGFEACKCSVKGEGAGGTCMTNGECMYWNSRKEMEM